MTTNTEQMRTHLQAFDFNSLFVSGLGWNHYRDNPLQITIESFNYVLESVAEKAGFAVFVCAPDADGAIPPYPIRRKIEHQVAQRAFEHLIIFVDKSHKLQIWQWVKRETGKPAACREMQYHAGQRGHALLDRIEPIVVSLENELKGIGITDVVSRVRRAMDIERVTKHFYDRFRGELTEFQSFIEGVTTLGDRDWYASLMLNRMMFIYFIQKQRFLDGDPDYLRHRLAMVQAQAGEGRYQQFYRMFLLRLFHEGLGQPEAERAPELAHLLGKVPFLNGGLFDVHDLERDNPGISIPDEAFERVFDFFDAYQWHLDDRPNMDDNEINPDVLGYIFEKYINQKQMGAYYTKEDITGYITQNTVIPFLFNAAEKECPVAFRHGGGVWRLLQDDPDLYIYPAVGHGMAWAYSPDVEAKRLPVALQLPDDIAKGISDVSLRHGWNASAPDDYALPTETWREVVARRRRYEEVRAKLAAGEVQSINDLITLNLDIERFAKDVVTQSEGPELLRAFWHSLTSVSVLDPTCGSGAFLFAALNILEPLYTICLEGMQGFLQDLEVSQRTHSPNALNDFRKVMNELEQHPNEQYFILKSIVLNNLYGVDIMEEATEICKLRLFLKLVAQLEEYGQIEPLPDIDFNIRAGNTLVGFTSLDAVRSAMTVTPDGQSRMLSDEDNTALARINEEAEIAARAFDQFRRQQTELGGEITAADKSDLRRRLDGLRGTLDRHLAADYGVQPDDTDAYESWRTSHQPFHWFVEFYGVMQDGGFDVIVGNPPYLETGEVPYSTRHFISETSRAIHALCVERGTLLCKSNGSMSMIVPLSLVSTQRMTQLHYLLENGKDCWFSNFSWRPGKLFDTVNRALTIFVVARPKDTGATYSTSYIKWHAKSRDYLITKIQYVECSRNRKEFWVPKIEQEIEKSILEKCTSIRSAMEDFVGRSEYNVYYRTDGGLYWKVFTDFPPRFSVNGVVGSSSRETKFSLARKGHEKSAVAILSSDVFWWWYTITSNLRHLNPSDWKNFPVPKSAMDSPEIKELAVKYISDLGTHSTSLVRNQKRTGRTETQSFKIQRSKPIIDEIDRVLAGHYGFTDEELDYIINYDIKYRMGL